MANDDEKIKRLREFRSLCKQHFDLVMRLDAIAKKKDELETKDVVQVSLTQAKMFKAIAEVNKFASNCFF